MLRKLILPVLVLALAYAFWASPVFNEIAAGVAILLLGMMLLEEGFRSFTDGPLEKIIRASTDKLYKGITVGGVATALLQSSSLISIVVISFLSAGLMSLKSGIGVIYGANIGTTATAWLVSAFGLTFKISALAMPMLAFGILLVFQKAKTLKGAGNVLTGLGMFFLGIHYMKEGFAAIESELDLAAYAMPGITGIVVYVAVGIFITVILQSSSASLALILTALAAGHITYINAIAVAIGANIGTTITAILGSLGANIAGKRLAVAHLIFNFVTGVVAVLFIHFMINIVDFIAFETGIKASNYTLKLSIFHTIFNVVGVLLLLPFTSLLARKLEQYIKEKPDPGIEYPKHLNKLSLDYPAAAIEALTKESKYLFKNATFEIVAHGLHLHREDIKSDRKIGELVKSSREKMNIDVDELYYKKVKVIYSKIIEYASLIQQKNIGAKDVAAVARIKQANRNIVEAIKNVRGLHANVGKFMVSDNEFIRKEYDKLRKKISKVLRELYLTRKDNYPEAHLDRLNKLRLKAEKSDVLVDGSLDKLIRSGHISSEMATSLANDSDAVARISRHLINAAELLYIDSDTIFNNNHQEDSGEEEISM